MLSLLHACTWACLSRPLPGWLLHLASKVQLKHFLFQEPFSAGTSHFPLFASHVATTAPFTCQAPPLCRDCYEDRDGDLCTLVFSYICRAVKHSAQYVCAINEPRQKSANQPWACPGGSGALLTRLDAPQGFRISDLNSFLLNDSHTRFLPQTF